MSRARFDPVLAAQGLTSHIARIEAVDLFIFVLHCLRVPAFYAEARQHVRAHHFDVAGSEAHYGLLWTVLDDYHRDFHGQAFVASTVLDMTSRRVNDTPLVVASQWEELLSDSGIIVTAFSLPESSLHEAYARRILQRFLVERTVVRPLNRVLQPDIRGGHSANIPEYLRELNNHMVRVSSLESLPTSQTAVPLGAWTSPSSVYRLTGLSFIDDPLGGQRDGDCNGILGATGVGKSTLGSHMLVAAGRASYAEAMTRGGTPQISALFTYEEPMLKVLPRVLSTAMQIRRNKLECMQSHDELTTRNNMEAYESRLAVQGEVLCERERWEVNAPWLNATTKIFDMSGSADFPGAGYGFVDEIASCLERTADQAGTGFRTVVVDWAGLVCERHMEAQNMPQEDLRRLLSQIGDECRRKVAERFGCTVWLLHQLKAEAGSRSALKLMHHTDAGESKSFAIHLAVCGCLGTKDPKTGCILLNWSKSRAKSQIGVPPRVLQINNTFAQIDDMSQEFAVDDISGSFIGRNEFAQISGGMSSRQGRVRSRVGEVVSDDYDGDE